jgi:hypothetical protein
MKSILTFLNGIHKDRWQHFTMGIIVSSVTFLIMAIIAGKTAGMMLSAMTLVVVALWKERYDAATGGRFDFIDLVVTLAGGLSVWVWIVLFVYCV